MFSQFSLSEYFSFKNAQFKPKLRWLPKDLIEKHRYHLHLIIIPLDGLHLGKHNKAFRFRLREL